MRILIVYASNHGHTRRIVEHIADIARSCGAETRFGLASEMPLDLMPHAFDAVVIAGSVHFGRHQKSLERFVIRHRENLAKTRTAFVSVSGAAREDHALAADQARAFFMRTLWNPDHIELFAGGAPYTRYNFLLRWFMVHLARKAGEVVDPKRDYDYTDWMAVELFARELAGKETYASEPELALM